MTEIKIFLAHTSEVKEDVEEIQAKIYDKYSDYNFKLNIQHWKKADLAIAENRVQDNINLLLFDCELLYIFFHVKVGEFTLEEFKIGYESFKKGDKPYSLTPFFKELPPTSNISDQENQRPMLELKEEIKNINGNQFPHEYKEISDLKEKIFTQLEKDIKKLIDKGVLSDSPKQSLELCTDKNTLSKEILFRIDELIQEKKCCECNIRIKQDTLFEELIQSGFSEENIYNSLHDLVIKSIIQKDKIEILYEDKYQIMEHISLTSYGRKVIFKSK